MRKIFLGSVLLVMYFTGNAQITGNVMDSASKQPVDKAIVGLVIKSAQADTTYYFTNEKGEFSISPVPASDFSLVFSSMNYRPVAKFIPVKSPQKTISIGNVILAGRSLMLDEVYVQSAPIVIKEDTIEYRADAFKVKENATTEDLLKKLPGTYIH